LPPLWVVALASVAVAIYSNRPLGSPAAAQPSAEIRPLVVAVSSRPTPADPCVSIQAAQVNPGVQSSFPARTVADVLAGAPSDPAMRLTFQDIAGVRPGPLADPRVPRCRIDLLQLGDPVFVRMYPATTGSWLVPIMFQGQTLETLYVDVDAAGMGSVGGSRGGVIPIPTEAAARAAGALPGDAVVDAQLVFARPPGCGGALTPVWRVVRASGSVAYFALDVLNAKPPGVLFEEKDMRVGLGHLVKVGYASLAGAC
jgi:hypothetical protein